MTVHLVLCVLSSLAIMASVNSCGFGNEAIQPIYDRFQLFREKKAIDPTNSKAQLTQYSYYDDSDGVKRLA